MQRNPIDFTVFQGSTAGLFQVDVLAWLLTGLSALIPLLIIIQPGNTATMYTSYAAFLALGIILSLPFNTFNMAFPTNMQLNKQLMYVALGFIGLGMLQIIGFMLGQFMKFSSIGDTITFATLAPAAEEFMFAGFLFALFFTLAYRHGFSKQAAFLIGCIPSCPIFALYHLAVYGLAGIMFLVLFLGRMILNGVYVASGVMFVPQLVHLGNNVVGVLGAILHG